MSLSFMGSMYSQTNIHSVGFDVGVISWEASNVNNTNIILPELFISGDFINSDFNWKINFGYWDDGIDKATITDNPTYSYSSFIIGTELIYLFPITNLTRPSPVRILGGFSYHSVTSKEIDNYGGWEDKSYLYTGNLLYADIGSEIHIELYKNFTTFFKVVEYYLLNDENTFVSRWRLQLSLGVNYSFR